MKLFARVLAIAFGMGVIGLSPVLADGTSFNPPKSELYLSLIGSRVSLKGDFNGTSAYVAPGAVIPVPKLETGTGIGGAIGYRKRVGATGWSALGFELYLAQSNHDATWLSAGGKASLLDWGFSGTWHLRADKRLQPFVKVGVGILRLQYTPEGISGADTDAFDGISYAFGGGVSYFLSERVSLDVAGQSVSSSFDNVGGTYGIKLEPTIDAQSVNFEGRVTYRFDCSRW